jgi:DNA-binding transcriptional regulator YiaG
MSQWDAKKIRQLRASLKMTQAEFAKVVRATQGQVSNWESGGYRPCRLNCAVLDLMKRYGVK